MNHFYASIAAGKDQNPPVLNELSHVDFVASSYFNSESHQSISHINSSMSKCNFNLKPIEIKDMTYAIKELNPKKATGFDGLSPKILAIACPVITQPLTYIFISCISNSYFPDLCKLADVRPVFKKADPLLKKIIAQLVF